MESVGIRKNQQNYLHRLFGTKQRKHPRCSKRIKDLAEPIPRRKRSKYTLPEYVPKKKRLDSLRKRNCSNRLLQLAAPPIRILVDNRNNFKHILNYRKQRHLDKQIRKRKFNMYSRLTNTDINQGDLQRSWTKEDWARHNAWLAKKARPKTCVEAPAPPNPKKPFHAMSRFNKLATPKYPPPPPETFFKDDHIKQGPRYVKPQALTYEPSENIKKLCQPKSVFEKEDVDAYFAVKENAIRGGYANYKPSQRIVDLSKHKEFGIGEYILDKGDPSTLGKVKPQALKCKTTKRTEELSKPKPQPEKEDIEAAFKVSKRALTGKASVRTLELSEPKTR